MDGQWKLIWAIHSPSLSASILSETLNVAVYESYDAGDAVRDDDTGSESPYPCNSVYFGLRTGPSGEHLQTHLYDAIEEIQSYKERLNQLEGPYRLDLHCYVEETSGVSLSLQCELIALLNEIGAGFFISLHTASPSLSKKR